MEQSRGHGKMKKDVLRYILYSTCLMRFMYKSYCFKKMHNRKLFHSL